MPEHDRVGRAGPAPPTAAATPATPATPERRRLAWSTRELMVVAAVSVAVGVALIPVGFGYLAAVAAGPLAAASLSGLLAVPAVLAMLVARRPGACVLGAGISGLVMAAFTGLGWAFPLGAAVLAVPVEVVFALGRYRRFGALVVLGGAGVVVAARSIVVAWVPVGLGALSVPAIAAFVAVTLASAVAACAVAFGVAHALVRTGVVRHRDGLTGPGGDADMPGSRGGAGVERRR